LGNTLTQKIIGEHLLSGNMVPGEEVGIRIDQTLTQDATGTMAYLEFEAMGIERVKTELSVAYIDHNTLQTGFENADDHRFIQSVAKKRGILFSKPGNGICHQVHLERFGVPGNTLIGSDSHTPTGGASVGLFHRSRRTGCCRCHGRRRLLHYHAGGSVRSSQRSAFSLGIR
jgi:aconitate hydratase